MIIQKRIFDVPNLAVDFQPTKWGNLENLYVFKKLRLFYRCLIGF